MTVTYQVTADAALVTQTSPGRLQLDSSKSKDITFYTADSGGTALAVWWCIVAASPYQWEGPHNLTYSCYTVHIIGGLEQER